MQPIKQISLPLIFLILAMASVFVYAATVSITAVEKTDFLRQTAQATIADGISPSAQPDSLYDMSEGRTLKLSSNIFLVPGQFTNPDLKPLSEEPDTPYYISFKYGDTYITELYLMNHKKSTVNSTTGIFDFMVVDYTRNPDGTPRLKTGASNPPKKFFFRINEGDLGRVIIPGVGIFTEFKVDETINLNYDGYLEQFTVTFDESYYSSIPKLVEDRKAAAGTSTTGTTPGSAGAVEICTTISHCLAILDTKLVKEAVKTPIISK